MRRRVLPPSQRPLRAGSRGEPVRGGWAFPRADLADPESSNSAYFTEYLLRYLSKVADVSANLLAGSWSLASAGEICVAPELPGRRGLHDTWEIVHANHSRGADVARAPSAARPAPAHARESRFQLHSRPPRQRLPSSLVIEGASAFASRRVRLRLRGPCVSSSRAASCIAAAFRRPTRLRCGVRRSSGARTDGGRSRNARRRTRQKAVSPAPRRRRRPG